MDVVQVAFEVSLVADDMFPEPPLPYAAPPIPLARVADVAFPPAGGDPGPREGFLDSLPPRGIVRIPPRQRPHRMEIIRKQANATIVNGSTARQASIASR